MKTPPQKRQPKIRVLNPDVPRDLDVTIRKMVEQEEKRKKEESSNKLHFTDEEKIETSAHGMT